MRPKILIVSFTDLRRDPRVHRQIAALSELYTITTAGVCPNNNYHTKHIELKNHKRTLIYKIVRLIRLLFRRYETVYWNNKQVLEAYKKCNQGYDAIICNDVETLPLCVKIADGKVPLLADLHEYEPLHYNDQLLFRLFLTPFWDYICKKYLPKTNAVSTVCDGIAREYDKNYGTNCRIVYNAPAYENISPTPVDGGDIKIIHHGGINTSRHLENMIYLMKYLDEKYSLYLMFVNTDDVYYTKLKNLADNYPRVFFVDSVPMLDIVSEISKYDLGLCMLPAKNFNYKLALPNKIFEFIQARLGIVTWPSEEIAKIVKRNGLGIVSSTRSIPELADMLNRLSVDEIVEFKCNTHRTASMINSGHEGEKIRSMVSKMLG